jgi:hypothetical protein
MSLRPPSILDQYAPGTAEAKDMLFVVYSLFEEDDDSLTTKQFVANEVKVMDTIVFKKEEDSSNP